MKRSFLLLAVLSAFTPFVWSQPLSLDYIHSVQGLNKADLKTALHDLIQPRLVLAYGGGDGHTWSGFALTDVMPDGVTVRDRYSEEQRTFDGNKAVNGMNIEHIWANSWWGHTENNAYRDLFNLYPADGYANGRKSNNPIGVVDGATSFDNGVTKVGKSSSYSSDQLITAWEPADEWKGDFARTYFYMATTYQHMTDEWQTTEGLLTIDPTSWTTMRPWVYELMLEWAEADPVDDIERARNEVIYGIQGNRNPYVDMPELADYVWGDCAEERFYIDPQSTASELFVPMKAQTFDYGLQALSKGLDTVVVVRGRHIAEGLTLTVDNPAFEIGTPQVSAEQLEAGYAVPLRIKPEAAGHYAAALTITGGGVSQTNPLSISFVDGIPAYEATDIVCTSYVRRFTANWMAYEPGATYTLEVYTKNTDGSHNIYKTYTTQDTQYQVTSVQANTLYYYTVSIIEDEVVKATSNEVSVLMPEVKPVFTVAPSSISFAAAPERPSRAVQVTVKAVAVPEYVTTVSLELPFEVSADGEDWSQTLVLTGSEQKFLVRLCAGMEPGDYEGEMVLTTKGLEERIVTLSATVDAMKAFFENFESGAKNGYAEESVTCNASVWKMTDALIGALENDKLNDGWSVRLRNKGSIEMLEDKANGCDSLWFYAGSYGTDTGVKLSAYYSLDAGANWTVVAENIVMGAWQRYAYALKVDGNIRLRFVNNGSSEKKRSNLDDIQMSDYGSSDGLLKIDGLSGSDAMAVYTLDGRYIGNAMPSRRGIYIVRQGDRIMKIRR